MADDAFPDGDRPLRARPKSFLPRRESLSRRVSDAIDTAATSSSTPVDAALVATITATVYKILAERDASTTPLSQSSPTTDSQVSQAESEESSTIASQPTTSRVSTNAAVEAAPQRRASSPPRPAQSPTRQGRVRPAAPNRVPTTSVIEKAWLKEGPLFDGSNRPTAILGLLCRGLANYIIESYEPRRSLVISPKKMYKFFCEDVRLPEESYPFTELFTRSSNADLSLFYRALKCEHHYIQPALSDRPVIPALTPAGFEHFMCILIPADPNKEWERMSKAVELMPLSIPETSDRWPKLLPRKLFIEKSDDKPRVAFEDALYADKTLSVMRSYADEPPTRETSRKPQDLPGKVRPPSAGREAPRSSDLPQESSQWTREPLQSSKGPPARSKRLSTSSVIIDSWSNKSDLGSDELPTTAFPIERERKPYSAQPGGGKTYQQDGERNENPLQRTTSATARSQHGSLDGGAPPRFRSGSVSVNQGPSRTGQQGRADQGRADVSTYVEEGFSDFSRLSRETSIDERTRQYIRDRDRAEASRYDWDRAEYPRYEAGDKSRRRSRDGYPPSAYH